MPEMTDLDALVEAMRYQLTAKDSKNQRVQVPKYLLDQAKTIMKQRTGLTTITNTNLITYALLNLFPDNYQDKLSNRLLQVKKKNPLSTMLASRKDPELKPSKQMNYRLQKLEDNQLSQDIILEALVNGLAWLIADRNGLDQLAIAQNSDEIYAKLRQDDLKSIIDTLLRAGFNEDDRQKHLNNL